MPHSARRFRPALGLSRRLAKLSERTCLEAGAPFGLSPCEGGLPLVPSGQDET